MATLDRLSVAQRIYELPPDQQARAAELALQVFGPRVVRDRLPSMGLAEFVRGGWHALEPSRQLAWGWHIDAICEHLEAVTVGQIRRLIINVPPGHMKSLLVAVFWPAWVWTFMPWTRWIFSSYAQTLSSRDSRKCRHLIRSPWYQARWGHVYQLSGDQNNQIRFENTQTGFRLATSVTGVSTGERGDFLVFDDPLKTDEAHSDARRESVNVWFDEAFSTRLNEPEHDAIVGIAQRTHAKDLPGHLLGKQGSIWEHLVLPAEWEPPRGEEAEEHGLEVPPEMRNTSRTSLGFVDPRTKPGALLWETRFPQHVLDEYKVELGSYGYSGQFQQRPAPAEGGIFKRQWWRFWIPNNMTTEPPPVRVVLPDGEVRSAELVKIPLHFDLRAQSWDMAFKDTKDSAYVVGQYWGAWKALRFLLDQVRGKWDFTATVRQVQAFTTAHPDGPVWVEDKANGPAVLSTLRDKVPGLLPVEPHGDKVARGRAEQPYVEAGNVILPHPMLAPWVWDFIEESAAFPNGPYKDQVDAFTQANLRLRRWIAATGGGEPYTTLKR